MPPCHSAYHHQTRLLLVTANCNRRYEWWRVIRFIAQNKPLIRFRRAFQVRLRIFLPSAAAAAPSPSVDFAPKIDRGMSSAQWPSRRFGGGCNCSHVPGLSVMTMKMVQNVINRVSCVVRPGFSRMHIHEEDSVDISKLFAELQYIKLVNECLNRNQGSQILTTAFNFTSTSLSLYLSLSLSLYLSIYLSIYLSVCVCVSFH